MKTIVLLGCLAVMVLGCHTAAPPTAKGNLTTKFTDSADGLTNKTRAASRPAPVTMKLFSGEAMQQAGPEWRFFAWEYPADVDYRTNIIFNIYHSTNLAAGVDGFTHLGDVLDQTFWVRAVLPCEFFIVRASNQVSGDFSEWASGQ